ncbi:MAG: hypothetical protein EBX49_10220, partial [Synechococcaceae bacterium WB8_1B_136]|nr:hypothetical protein [Synechococcaceae bacterium WB8_1B_136]
MQLSELNLSGLQVDRGSFLPGNPTSIKDIDLDDQSQSRSPSNETAEKAFDGDSSTKYLNLGGSNSGFELTYGLDTKITGFTITTARDSDDYPRRDPISYQLYGLNNDTWTLISSGDLLTPTIKSKEFYTKVDSPSYNQQYRLV